MPIKAVILIGGPNKGQRFRPLSFDSPKYMFPVGGETILGHLIRSCLELDNLSEIILLGFYQPDQSLSQSNLDKLMQECQQKQNIDTYKTRHVSIRYFQEFTRMGTAGGIYHYRDQIRHGAPEAFLLINGDVCGDFDFDKMLDQHRNTINNAAAKNLEKPLITVMTTEASRSESQNYGCIVAEADRNPTDHSSCQIRHYVEKPSTFVSNIINCGAYVCSLELLDVLKEAMQTRRDEIGSIDSHQSLNPLGLSDPDYLSLELSVLSKSPLQSRCYSYKTQGSWWCQVKTAASAIYANKQYLKQYKTPNLTDGDRPLNCTLIGDVYVHPTAKVDPSAVIGPNVSIMENCVIGQGVRAKESIILQGAIIYPHSLVSCSIVGWSCNVGSWTRVEGTSSEPDPNEKYAKVQNPPLFNRDGKLNPSISVLGCNVKIPDGTVILNSIVLPHKELSRSYKNEIAL